MNTSSRHFLNRMLLAGLFALALAMHAQEPPAPPEKPAPPPAAAEKSAAPTAEPALRRIDQPDTPATVEPKNDAEKPDAAPEEKKSPADTKTKNHRRSRHASGDFPFGDHFVPKGSRMQEAVSIMGSSTVEGETDRDVVSIGGNTTIGPEATVGGAAVAVLGRVDSQGDVRGEAVSVLGGMTIDGHVHGEAVSVLGDMNLGPHAIVDGDLVVVGSKLTKAAGAVVNGNEVHVPIMGMTGDLAWFVTWVKECALHGRLLGFGPNLGWAWLVALSFLAFYLLLALLFPRGIEKCTTTLEMRPGRSILASVLTVLLSPVAIILLAITIVGALLIPFLAAGLFFAMLFGKAVMLAWFGRRFTRFFGDGPLSHPVFAVLIGGVILLLLYTVPVLSLLLFKLIGWLGLGVVVYTVLLSIRREKPPAAPAAAPVAPMTGETGFAAPGIATDPTPATSANFGMSPASVSAAPAAAAEPASAAAMPVVPPLPPMPPPVSPGFGAPSSEPPPAIPPMASVPPPAAPFRPRPSAVVLSTLPRAGFFIRLAAMLLDLILVAVVSSFYNSMMPRLLQLHNGPFSVLPLLAAYAAIMWKVRGTTVGGIICGLKVARLDNREIDWPTAIVRALGCFLSLVVAGLGFIWVAIDDERQSWHDKIAGTTIVHVPKGAALL